MALLAPSPADYRGFHNDGGNNSFHGHSAHPRSDAASTVSIAMQAIQRAKREEEESQQHVNSILSHRHAHTQPSKLSQTLARPPSIRIPASQLGNSSNATLANIERSPLTPWSPFSPNTDSFSPITPISPVTPIGPSQSPTQSSLAMMHGNNLSAHNNTLHSMAMPSLSHSLTIPMSLTHSCHSHGGMSAMPSLFRNPFTSVPAPLLQSLPTPQPIHTTLAAMSAIPALSQSLLFDVPPNHTHSHATATQLLLPHTVTNNGNQSSPLASRKRKFDAANDSENDSDDDDDGSNGDGVAHPCPFQTCNKTFYKPSALKRHVRTHTGERPFVCSVPGCGLSFAERGNLKRHERVHSGLKPYRCHLCQHDFARRCHLVQHIKAKHANLTEEQQQQAQQQQQQQ